MENNIFYFYEPKLIDDVIFIDAELKTALLFNILMFI